MNNIMIIKFEINGEEICPYNKHNHVVRISLLLRKYSELLACLVFTYLLFFIFYY